MEKCQIPHTIRARRLQTSWKCHWLDNMRATELTLDTSASISSKTNREMGEEQRRGSSWIITIKKKGEISSPMMEEQQTAQKRKL